MEIKSYKKDSVLGASEKSPVNFEKKEATVTSSTSDDTSIEFFKRNDG